MIKISSAIIEIILKYSAPRKSEIKMAMPPIMLNMLPNLFFELISFIEANSISNAYKVMITFTIIGKIIIYFSFLRFLKYNTNIITHLVVL